MSAGKTRVEVAIPTPDAADLALRAADEGVRTADFLGYHVLRSAYGAAHPVVVAFDKRPKPGRTGENPDEGKTIDE